MSGIAGIVSLDGGPVDATHVQVMADKMSHRGRDGMTQGSLDNACFAHCKMATTIENVREIQPFFNDTKTVMLVLGGRLDNGAELLSALGKGTILSNNASDAELLLACYERWGDECLTKVTGDFSLAIWNSREQSLLIARDHNGNKPLHYHFDGKRFSFASDLNAILALPWVEQRLNQSMIAQYLAIDWFSQTDTLWKDIQRVQPAHYLKIDRNCKLSEHRHWEPNLDLDLPCKSLSDVKHYYKSLFTDVVQRMTRSQCPVGFEVSGGLDSSALFGVAVDLQKNGKLNAPALLGYTLDFAGEGAADELNYVDAVSAHTGVNVSRIPPTILDYDWYQSIAKETREFPGYPNGTMMIGPRDTAVKDGCRVMITGVGGDEWVGSFLPGARYRQAMQDRNLTDLVQSLRLDMSGIGWKATLGEVIRHGMLPLTPRVIKNVMRTQTVLRQHDWLNEQMEEMFQRERMSTKILDGMGQKHPLQVKVLQGAYDTLGRDAEERMAARQGVEIRSPFFSKELIQFGFSAKGWMLEAGGKNKWLHRQALSEFMPENVTNRPDKADFMNVFRTSIIQNVNLTRSSIIPNNDSWIKCNVMNRYLDFVEQGHENGSDEWKIWSLTGCDLLNQTSNPS